MLETTFPQLLPDFSDRKGTPKSLCNKDFAELSGELSGAICLKTLALSGSALELFTEFFAEANRTRKFTRKFGKVFVSQVLWGTFSVTEVWQKLRESGF